MRAARPNEAAMKPTGLKWPTQTIRAMRRGTCCWESHRSVIFWLSPSLTDRHELDSSVPERRRVMSGDSMKKARNRKEGFEDRVTLRPEYDFTGAVRGVTAERYARGTNIVAVDPAARSTMHCMPRRRCSVSSVAEQAEPAVPGDGQKRASSERIAFGDMTACPWIAGHVGWCAVRRSHESCNR